MAPVVIRIARSRWTEGRAAVVRARGLVALLLTTVLVALAGCRGDAGDGPTGDWQPGTAQYELTLGGLRRTFLVHVPTHRPTTSTGVLRAYPLLLLLHGSNADGTDVEFASRMDSIADVYGYVVAYPNAYRAGGGLYPADWNAGTCCGAPQRQNIDDLGFLSAVITTAQQQLPIDARRIYVAGFSSGALMTYSAACHLAGTIAAIGIVEGSLADDQCAPANGVPLVAVQGTADESVTYADPSLTAPPTAVPAAAAALPASVQYWVSVNGCTTARDSATSAHVRETRFTACPGGDVTAYVIAGGQHGWPGEPAGGLGAEPPMVELDFSRAMIGFFNRHRKR